MDLHTATPAEIDTVLADVYERTLRAEITLGQHERTLRYYENSAHSQHLAAGVREDVTKAKDAVRALNAEAAPYEDEFSRRGGWTRAFLVLNTGGHVHRSMSCSTCYPTTQYGWLPQVSGLDEAEIVAQAGSDACTVCYPTAPVATAGARTLLHKSEEEAAAARAAREEARAKRAAAKAAKAIAAADGSPLRVYDYTSPERAVRDRDGSVRVIPATERFLTLETAHAARGWLTDSQEGWSRPKRAEDIAAVAQALAAKAGTTPEAEIEAAAKRAAKRR